MTQPAFKPEPFFSIAQVREQFFPGRSERWVRERVRTRDFGDVVRDGGGWLVPQSGVLAYLEKRRVSIVRLVSRPEQKSNLVQFQE